MHCHATLLAKLISEEMKDPVLARLCPHPKTSGGCSGCMAAKLWFVLQHCKTTIDGSISSSSLIAGVDYPSDGETGEATRVSLHLHPDNSSEATESSVPGPGIVENCQDG